MTRAGRSVLCLAVALGACSEEPVTQLVVVVGSDLDPGTELLRVEVAAEGDERVVATGAVAGPGDLPATVGLVPAGGAAEDVRVTVRGYGTVPGGEQGVIVEQGSATRFLAGRSVRLDMRIDRACVGVTCGSGLTCSAGACVSEEADPSTLPPWTGAATTADGGVPDAGAAATTAIDVALGTDHGCAIGSEGRGWCWGDNASGQLGNGSTIPSAAAWPIARLAESDPRLSAIGAGHGFSCAIGSSAVYCWGANEHGQLGDGTTRPSGLPRRVDTGGDVNALAVGAGHACAVVDGGRVLCWGDNRSGQLGDRARGDMWASPVPVSGVVAAGRAGALAAGQEHTCAIGLTGRMWCWGANGEGQLGAGSTEPRDGPVDVLAVEGMTEPDFATVVAGGGHTCALLTDGALVCWGAGTFHQLGFVAESRSRPALVADITLGRTAAGVVAAGASHTCAIVSGVVWCWGANEAGQLGDPSRTIGVTGFPPGEVALEDQASRIALGVRTSCAVLNGGAVRCWGAGDPQPRRVPGLL